NLMIKDRWRNGSALDSRPKGYLFKSGVVQYLFIIGCCLFALLTNAGTSCFAHQMI
ncbi:hypothetical protein B0O99DRAFT_508096, partial [Bisporella sp. PMI_857]